MIYFSYYFSLEIREIFLQASLEIRELFLLANLDLFLQASLEIRELCLDVKFILIILILKWLLNHNEIELISVTEEMENLNDQLINLGPY